MPPALAHSADAPPPGVGGGAGDGGAGDGGAGDGAGGGEERGVYENDLKVALKEPPAGMRSQYPLRVWRRSFIFSKGMFEMFVKRCTTLPLNRHSTNVGVHNKP